MCTLQASDVVRITLLSAVQLQSGVRVCHLRAPFLQMGSFQLRVRRSIDAPDAAPAVTLAAAPAAAAPVAAAPAPYVSVDNTPAEESIDEALVYVTAPKVGEQ